MSEYTDQELIEALRRTKDIFGALYPVLVDKDGNVIDGFHRLEADPNWPTVEVDWIKSEIDIEALRLIANLLRRTISSDEKKRAITTLIELTGWNPKRISDSLGIPYRTVIRYIPDEYKREYQREPHSNCATVALTTPDLTPDSEKEPENQKPFFELSLQNTIETPTESTQVEEEEEDYTGLYTEPIEDDKEDPIPLDTITPETPPQPVSAYTPPSKETVEDTIKRFYAQFPTGDENFILSVIQNKHHVTLEEARGFLNDYTGIRPPAIPEIAIPPTPKTAICPLCGSETTEEILQEAYERNKAKEV